MDVYTALQSAMSDKCTLTVGVVPVDNVLFSDAGKLFDSAKIILRKAKLKGKNKRSSMNIKAQRVF